MHIVFHIVYCNLSLYTSFPLFYCTVSKLFIPHTTGFSQLRPIVDNIGPRCHTVRLNRRLHGYGANFESPQLHLHMLISPFLSSSWVRSNLSFLSMLLSAAYTKKQEIETIKWEGKLFIGEVLLKQEMHLWLHNTLQIKLFTGCVMSKINNRVLNSQQDFHG